jgi:hypothetical protein
MRSPGGADRGGSGGTYSSGNSSGTVGGGQSGNLWLRPGRIMMAARTSTWDGDEPDGTLETLGGIPDQYGRD